MGMPGNPGSDVVRGAVVVVFIGGPGWVVIATVPGVVRSQPALPPARISATPAITKTCVLIP